MKHLDRTKHVVDILEHVLEGVHIEEHQLLAQEQSHPVDGSAYNQFHSLVEKSVPRPSRKR